MLELPRPRKSHGCGMLLGDFLLTHGLSAVARVFTHMFTHLHKNDLRDEEPAQVLQGFGDHFQKPIRFFFYQSFQSQGHIFSRKHDQEIFYKFMAMLLDSDRILSLSNYNNSKKCNFKNKSAKNL